MTGEPMSKAAATRPRLLDAAQRSMPDKGFSAASRDEPTAEWPEKGRRGPRRATGHRTRHSGAALVRLLDPAANRPAPKAVADLLASDDTVPSEARKASGIVPDHRMHRGSDDGGRTRRGVA